jgi:hypothetical protein
VLYRTDLRFPGSAEPELHHTFVAQPGTAHRLTGGDEGTTEYGLAPDGLTVITRAGGSEAPWLNFYELYVDPLPDWGISVLGDELEPTWEVPDFAYLPDSTAVLVLGDLTVAGRTEAYLVPLTTGAPGPMQALRPPVAGGDVDFFVLP